MTEESPPLDPVEDDPAAELAALRRILSTVAHQIKGALTGLEGGIYLMGAGPGDEGSERERRGWEMVRRNVERIRYSVTAQLHHYKPRPLRRQPVDLEAIAERAVEDLSRRYAASGLVPEICASGTIEITADPEAMGSLLANLLELAQASAPGGELPALALGMGRAGATIELTISADAEESIGSSAELAIAERIITAHGGTLETSATGPSLAELRVVLPADGGLPVGS